MKSERPKREDEQTPFERFASSTKKLFAVSNQELEQMAEEAKAKSDRKRRVRE